MDDLVGLALQWKARQEDMLEPDDNWKPVPDAGISISALGLDDLIQRLEGEFSGILAFEDNNVRYRQERLLRLAAEIYLARVGISVTPEEPATAPAPSQSGQEVGSLLSSQPFLSSPPLEPSQEDSEVPAAEKEVEEPVSHRLRRYAPMRPLMMTEKTTRTMISTHWELGGDLERIDWKPGKLVEEDEGTRRKRKMEARRRRTERLSMMIFSDGAALEKAESQPILMPIPMTSQPRESFSVPIPQSSQTTWIPSQTLSQPQAGKFGAKMKLKKGRQSIAGFK